jgi:hypothetical protein
VKSRNTKKEKASKGNHLLTPSRPPRRAATALLYLCTVEGTMLLCCAGLPGGRYDQLEARSLGGPSYIDRIGHVVINVTDEQCSVCQISSVCCLQCDISFCQENDTGTDSRC